MSDHKLDKYYKEFICSEQNYLNRNPKSLRIEILMFLINNSCKKYITESLDGCRIDLDALPSNVLEKLYFFICHKLGIDQKQLYTNNI